MPALLEGSSPRKIEFVVSLPHCLLTTAALACAVPRFEGLGEWVHAAWNRMPEDLKTEICLFTAFPSRYRHLATELGAQLPANARFMNFDDLIAFLYSLPGSEYQRIALEALDHGPAPALSHLEILDLLDHPEDWAQYLARIESDVQPDVAASLMRDGEKIKSRLLNALSRFWLEFYEAEYQATLHTMERSIQFHQAQRYSANFEDLFTTITGRLVPDRVAEVLPEITDVTFIPSYDIGPYVAFTHHDNHLILYYNCRSTPIRPLTPDWASLYPPLKALADETRLHILSLLRQRELYAQEIVDQLDISQPAVSRHLNLMAAADVLHTRRDGNTKYYSVNSVTLARLADALRTLM